MYKGEVMDILKAVSNIIVDVLDEEDLVVTRDTTADDAEDWDSLTQIQIIDSIEKEFHIKLELADIELLNQAGCVGDTVDFISRKLEVTT